MYSVKKYILANIKITLNILILFLFFPFIIEATQSIKKTNTDQAKDKIRTMNLIYEDPDLKILDKILNLVYKDALAGSKAPLSFIHEPQIKKSQLKWYQDRPFIGSVKGMNLKEELVEYYVKGIIDLLKPNELYTYYLHNFFLMDEAVEENDNILLFSVLSLMNEQLGLQPIEFNDISISSIINKTLILPIGFNTPGRSANQFIFGLPVSEGIYRYTLNFFLLSFKDGPHIKPYHFEKPKKFQLENSAANSLIGDFNLDRKNNILNYSVHPRSSITGNQCQWKLTIDGGKLIKEIINVK